MVSRRSTYTRRHNYPLNESVLCLLFLDLLDVCLEFSGLRIFVQFEQKIGVRRKCGDRSLIVGPEIDLFNFYSPLVERFGFGITAH